MQKGDSNHHNHIFPDDRRRLLKTWQTVHAQMRGKEATNQAPEDSSKGEIGIDLLPHAARPVHLLARDLVMQMKMRMGVLEITWSLRRA